MIKGTLEETCEQCDFVKGKWKQGQTFCCVPVKSASA